MSAKFIGLDLGGTNIKCGITDETGKLLAKPVSIPTGVGSDVVIGNMITAARQALEALKLTVRDVVAVGVASPGPLSTKTGMIIKLANLPGWEMIPLRDRIAAGLGLPTVLENDANAAAFGEYWAGAGRSYGVKDMVMFTLGTGVGGGVIDHGRVVHGCNDFGAELGHIIVVPDGELCGCGQRGCLEVYASAYHTGRRATGLLKTNPFLQSSLRELVDRGASIEATDIEKHAKQGDDVAQKVWNDTCRFLALGIVTSIRFMDPELVVIAGGMCKAGDFLMKPLRQWVAYHNWKLTAQTCKIEVSTLGNDAGVIGAAGVAWDAWSRGELPKA